MQNVVSERDWGVVRGSGVHIHVCMNVVPLCVCTYTYIHTHMTYYIQVVYHTHTGVHTCVHMYVHTVTQGTVGIKFKIVDTDTRSVVTVQVACNVHTRFSSHTSQCYI